ncbi:hypothetical protein [Roseomonas sp. 18066]|uniref:hypothetical protein n=1 Tax=Roseomonas sp. 18066 TaxID=2681412 RepID=UPI0013569AF0|nr:hypothetical protein [Roseomonas sp. 18066]
MNITIEMLSKGLQEKLDTQRKRVREVTLRAVNYAAEEARDAVKREMAKVFDRPTPYTLNSVRVDYARWNNIEASVNFKQPSRASKNTPPSEWVGVQVRGGPRDLKRSERAISFKRGNRSFYLVPTRWAELDSFGNASRGQLVKILSALDSLKTRSRSKARGGKPKRSRGRRRNESYFAVFDERPGLKPGIYQRKASGFGSGVVPIYLVTRKAPTYSKRLDFDATVRRSLEMNLSRIWHEEWSRPTARDLRPDP